MSNDCHKPDDSRNNEALPVVRSDFKLCIFVGNAMSTRTRSLDNSVIRYCGDTCIFKSFCKRTELYLMESL